MLEARYLLAVDLVDKIRGKIMEKMNSRRRIARKWKGNLVPYADRFCQDLSKKLESFSQEYQQLEYGIENEVEGRIINLRDKTCRNRSWKFTRLPCIQVGNFTGNYWSLR